MSVFQLFWRYRRSAACGASHLTGAKCQRHWAHEHLHWAMTGRRRCVIWGEVTFRV